MTHQATDPKQVQIALQYPCFICKEVFDTAVDVKSHVIDTHHYPLPDMPSNVLGETRPAEDNVEFTELPDSEEDAKDIKIHSACPSCWFHCPARDALKFEVHIIETHSPCSNDTSQEQAEASTTATSPSPPSQDTEQQEIVPTVEDLYQKLGDLAECVRAYMGRE
ncbi:hypothetical protein V8B55DRAFT_1005084 [Mucor lusitanicus]|uniref:C2H2-type zinc finger transcription factor n=2 Tax=Mucor circinelloides f. lusitanicus TaxID=29924 RepID=A0A168K3F9_MUCCL|nr:C2H2-type zinc finger transcription factor [Mucor lusitanicus]OAD01953.1 C2H2-type zinc finger transcription factor [Mucor lusitanicus CBS 277.49]